MDTQLDDATKFKIKLKKEDGKPELIVDNDIARKPCEDGHIILLSNLALETGYEYQFILECGEKEYKSNFFCLQGTTMVFTFEKSTFR